MKTRLPTLMIVTPYLAGNNNGNWRTARRWADMLSHSFHIVLQTEWNNESCDCMIALHARRSAPSVARWAASGKPFPLALCLTGTDLYSDVGRDPAADHSLKMADRLIVLQEDALRHVPANYRSKTQVIHQSSRALQPAIKPVGRLDCVMVGHIRREKDPLTALRALHLLPTDLPVRLQHIGGTLDDALSAQLRDAAAKESRYHWSGALSHGLTRAAIKRAHVLVHPSTMEGGANVIVEAITAGTSVLASEMSGNFGMLGKSYPGYFPVGDATTLARLMERTLQDANFRASLANACQARATLFSPEEEARRLNALVFSLISD
jgi:putative glycosyltransferase (TIGR04348 family)